MRFFLRSRHEIVNEADPVRAPALSRAVTRDSQTLRRPAAGTPEWAPPSLHSFAWSEVQEIESRSMRWLGFLALLIALALLGVVSRLPAPVRRREPSAEFGETPAKQRRMRSRGIQLQRDSSWDNNSLR
jgi:hypothetical protein